MNKIIGHKKQKDFLTKIALSEKIPHAFLFSGTARIGKTTTAIAFAKLILQDQKVNSPDLCIISPLNNNIEIDKIRDLREFLKLKSYNNKNKVAIIEDAHLMRKDSQNSILKILEEPPENSVLILVTSFSEMILDTIKSRVQKIDFSPVNKKEIENFLILKGAKKEEAEEISMFSSGKVGKAIEFLEDKEQREFFSETIKSIRNLKKQAFEKRFEYVKEIYEEKEKLPEILNIFERFFRRIMFLKLYNKEDNDFKEYSLLKIKNIIEEIEKTKYYLNNTNTNKKLLLENLIIKI